MECSGSNSDHYQGGKLKLARKRSSSSGWAQTSRCDGWCCAIVGCLYLLPARAAEMLSACCNTSIQTCPPVPYFLSLAHQLISWFISCCMKLLFRHYYLAPNPFFVLNTVSPFVCNKAWIKPRHHHPMFLSESWELNSKMIMFSLVKLDII